MTKSTIFAIAVASMLTCGFLTSGASAQDNVLAELYGRGVHAYYAGRQFDAQKYLTSAIDNGFADPRAYYFRGIIANSQGRSYDAEQDWKEGARIEATGTTNVAIGRSLSRFQGMARLKLEEIRRDARLAAMSGAPTRSQVRMNEIKAAQPPLATAVARPPVPQSSQPVTPPPIPPAPGNPFADDGGLAGGQPKVEKDDALAGAMDNPFKDDAAAAPAAGAAGGADVFSGGADDSADPFGGGAAADDAADPFGGGAGADPFGGGDTMDDPFGGSDPFGGN